MHFSSDVNIFALSKTFKFCHASGDPNADCFAVCRRGNSTVMVMCDGVNRGNKARMAARSAVYGALRYINAHCFEQGEQPMNTHVGQSFL